MALPRDRWLLCVCLLFLCVCFIGAVLVDVDKCEELRIGQYICDSPKINDVTQEPENCTNETAFGPCMPAPNITCRNYSGLVNTFTGKEVGFYKPFPCRNVSGYSYKVAVALSLFLGWLGADRFYLGYPALGLLKFCTVGFCGIGSLIDFVLISAQRIPITRKEEYHEHCNNGSNENFGLSDGVVL
ncbi:TM2 domain-containing protein 1 isoform X2 [Stegostoma tigrinum]|uniref:TM2 domain-containing protein 1 isoform X2 n=1 Tax=Stegostoma tigrinum TaxID=3053191 RepID=UPI00202B6D05|nr:TM2 domain-containing protein 1 isoform X2 [Stegostoma tigrinum]